MLKALCDLMVSFGKIGFVALGGGHSMLKLIEYEAVINRHWLVQEDFVSIVGTTFLFPGLTAVKIAAIIGYNTAGILGLIVAVISLNLPGLLMAVVGYTYLSSVDSIIARKILIAVQYGALALLAAASYSIATAIIGKHYSISLMLLCAFFFVCLAFFDVSPFWGLIAFIGIGFFLAY